MAEEAGEKKHAPSERGWRQAAEKGQLPRSMDINAAAVVFAGSAALLLLYGPMVQAVSNLATLYFDGSGPYTFDIGDAKEMLSSMTVATVMAISVPLGAVMVASAASNLAQTRMQLAPKALEPKWERLDIIAGMKQAYFSITPFVELAKGLAKFLVIGAAIVFALWSEIEHLPMMAAMHPSAQIEVYMSLAMRAILAAAPVIILIAAADYAASYYKSMKQLMRTDQQVREENKEAEGDPRFKGMRRQMARKIVMAVTLQSVRGADVIITNPTHYAVALRYRRGEDTAPIVLAKGVDHMALRIREEARKHEVPRVENRPLARALHARSEVNAPIPEDLFGPVARVLAVVLRKRRRKAL